MIVHCKKHKATFQDEFTCIKRQEILAKAEHALSQKGKQLPGYLSHKYNNFKSYCGGCEKGIEIYKKYLSGEIAMEEKRCSKCKQIKSIKLMHENSSICIRCYSLYLRDKTVVNPKKEKVKMNMKNCVSCGELKKCDRENFDWAPRAKDKLTKDCRVCRGTEQAKTITEVDILPESKVDPVPKPKKERTKIVIDVTKFPDLLPKLEEWADADMRTVNNQILFYFVSKFKIRSGE